MITITDKNYVTLCQISYDLPEGLLAYDDIYEKDLESGVSAFEFTVDKNDDLVGLIRVGCFVFAQDKDKIRTFEVMATEEDNNSKIVYAEDAGLDLLNEVTEPYEADKAYRIEDYINRFTAGSGWEIGINQISGRKLKLEWEGHDCATKRLAQLAGRFGVEIEYSADIVHGRVYRRLINIYKQRGLDKKVRLEYGVDVSGIRKKESIENLATAVRGVGQDNITLKGYTYDDGRYFIQGDVIYDRIEGNRWSRRGPDKDGYIIKLYESQAKSQKTLFDETLRKLKEWAYPEVQYQVSVDSFPEQLDVGDTVSIIDNDYKPALTIEARVSKISRSFSDPSYGTIELSNVRPKIDRISAKILGLARLAKEQAYNWSSIPYKLTVYSSNGKVFKDSNVATILTYRLTKADIDFSEGHSFRWTRKGRYSTTGDAAWNAAHVSVTGELEINIEDVDREATFTCTAYKDGKQAAKDSVVIKDFVIGRYKQPTEPVGAEQGAIWVDTSTEPNVLKILTSKGWQPVITRHDVTEEINSATKDLVKNEIFNNHKTDSDTSLNTLREQYDELNILLQGKAKKEDLNDLSGRFSNMEEGYEKVRNAAETIEGLGERTTILELNLEQSQAVINAIATHFTFGEDGLLIGKDGSSIMLRQENDKLSFVDGGKEVAYISNQRLYITSGVFVESLLVANHKIERLGDSNIFTVISYTGGAA